MEETAIKQLYRYERCIYSSVLEGVKINLVIYNIHSETPKGYWIYQEGYYQDKQHWVSKSGKKRFAYPTQEEAMINFKKRTERCVLILRTQLQLAEEFLRFLKDK